MAQVSKDVLSNERMYVIYWMMKEGVVVLPNGQLHDKLNRAKDEVFDTMWLDYIKDVKEYNAEQAHYKDEKQRRVPMAKETDMRKALSENISLTKATMKQKKRESLKCTGENLDPLKQFVYGITGEVDEVVVAVMAQFVWLVKRKLFQLETKFQIMPILYGPQASGKTMSVKSLIKPVEEFQLALKMNELVDSRYFFSLADNYIIVFDEMQHAARTDIDILKNQVTQTHNTPRKLNTHDVIKVPQNCTFIGTTNRPLSEQITDSTGMRRFFQINTPPKMDWELLSTINYDALWLGIDENRENGYTYDVRDKLDQRQGEWVTPEIVGLFFEEHGVDLKAPITSESLVTIHDIYATYNEWCVTNGHKPVTSHFLGRWLANRGHKSVIRSKANKSVRHYVFNKGHTFTESKVTNFTPKVIT